MTELSSPADPSSIAHGPSLARRAHRPQRISIASPAIAFTPAFRSQASRSSEKIRVPGSRYGTPFNLGMSYSTARVTIPPFMVRMEFLAAPPSLVTRPATGYPFHIFPPKNLCANESRWVVPAPWMQGYATRSVAPASPAVTIAHSTGHGTSMSFFVKAFDANDTDTPSLTRAAAALRLAGVTKFSVPISSSLPQRPQFESSVCQCSYSVCETSGCAWAAGEANGFADATTMAKAPNMAQAEAAVNRFVISSSPREPSTIFTASPLHR